MEKRLDSTIIRSIEDRLQMKYARKNSEEETPDETINDLNVRALSGVIVSLSNLHDL